MRLTFLATAFALFVFTASAQNAVPVFTGGEEGYPVYRIPAVIVAANGDILAFAEARQKLSDTSENDLVMKRSTDNGQSWQPLQLVAEDGAASLNNPCVITLRDGGRILLM